MKARVKVPIATLLSQISDQYVYVSELIHSGEVEDTSGAEICYLNVTDIGEDNTGKGRSVTIYLKDEGEATEDSWVQSDPSSRQKTVFYKQVEDWLITNKVKYSPNQLQVNEAGAFAMGWGAFDDSGTLKWYRFVCHKDSGSVEIEWINP